MITGRSCRAVVPDVRGAESSLGGTSPNFRKGLARKSQRDYPNKDRQLNCLGRSSRYTDSPLFWKPANSTHCYSGTRLSCEFEPPVLLAHFDSLLTCPDSPLSYQSRSDSICPNENAVSFFALSLFVNNGESFGSGSRVTAGSGILPARRQRFDLWARPNVGCPAIHRPE
jgi:hypothetical protein